MLVFSLSFASNAIPRLNNIRRFSYFIFFSNSKSKSMNANFFGFSHAIHLLSVHFPYCVCIKNGKMMGFSDCMSHIRSFHSTILICILNRNEKRITNMIFYLFYFLLPTPSSLLWLYFFFLLSLSSFFYLICAMHLASSYKILSQIKRIKRRNFTILLFVAIKYSMWNMMSTILKLSFQPFLFHNIKIHNFCVLDPVPNGFLWLFKWHVVKLEKE